MNEDSGYYVAVRGMSFEAASAKVVRMIPVVPHWDVSAANGTITSRDGLITLGNNVVDAPEDAVHVSKRVYDRLLGLIGITV